MKLLFLLIALLGPNTETPKTPFELGGGNKTATYQETIDFYNYLDTISEYCKMLEVGASDIGRPINLFVLSKSLDFDPEQIHEQGKAVLLINNGIHPGESCGIDASMMLARDLLHNNAALLPNDLIICIIPVYNIGGCLNRGAHSRANQNGPEEYGFRGNARNLDLNRDFIKCDSKNSRTLISVFNTWKPHVFIDTHTTDGADYQYTMTLIPTQKNKANNNIANYMESEMNPFLYKRMNQGKYLMCPYVNLKGESPDEGITGFLETGRYSSGYASLFNTISYISEAHMLKSYADRVNGTLQLQKVLISKMKDDVEKIVDLKIQADKETSRQKEFAVQYELDESQESKINFRGFEAVTKISDVSGQEIIFYDNTQSFERNINFYNTYTPKMQVTLPYAYVIPQAWTEVIDRLHWNGIQTHTLSSDVIIDVNCKYLDGFKSLDWAYEGHHINYETNTRTEKLSIQFYKGDQVIFTDQVSNRFLATVLEPESPDSYFSWNFFDSVIMQKEYFSGFVFDETAKQILNEDSVLKKLFEEKKSADEKFSKNHRAQLEWVYKHSPYYESTHQRLPVYRIESETSLKIN